MNMLKLFEAVLREADKSRFIKKMWAESGCDGVGCYSDYLLQDTIDFFNNHQNIKVDWQSKDTNLVTLWNIMKDYEKNKAEKDFKANLINLFKDKCFKVFKETENWIFVCPVSWQACVDDTYLTTGKNYYFDDYIGINNNFDDPYIKKDDLRCVRLYNFKGELYIPFDLEKENLVVKLIDCHLDVVYLKNENDNVMVLYNRESRRPQVKRFEVERTLQNEELAREALNGYK